MNNENTYTPVQYVYREVIEEEIQRGNRGKIFYYDDAGQVDSEEAKVTEMRDIPGQGMFILLDNDKQIRIDRILTLFGKPGAAYDAYDANANQCLDCTGGYPL
jgi:hypothetical protein